MITIHHVVPNDHAEALLELLDAITEATASLIVDDAVRLSPEEEELYTRALAVSKTVAVQLRKDLTALYAAERAAASAPAETSRRRDIIHRGRAILFARQKREGR